MKINKKQDEVIGKVKVAVMKCDAKFTDAIACIIYDTKTVHIISTVYDNFKWSTTKKKVYSKIKKKTVVMKFNCLNVIHMYNFGMISVDVSYQLSMPYRPYYCTRNRKWWWSILLWGLGGAATNEYLIYRGGGGSS